MGACISSNDRALCSFMSTTVIKKVVLLLLPGQNKKKPKTLFRCWLHTAFMVPSSKASHLNKVDKDGIGTLRLFKMELDKAIKLVRNYDCFAVGYLPLSRPGRFSRFAFIGIKNRRPFRRTFTSS